MYALICLYFHANKFWSLESNKGLIQKVSVTEWCCGLGELNSATAQDYKVEVQWNFNSQILISGVWLVFYTCLKALLTSSFVRLY